MVHCKGVLILVLMEVGLRDIMNPVVAYANFGIHNGKRLGIIALWLSLFLWVFPYAKQSAENGHLLSSLSSDKNVAKIRLFNDIIYSLCPSGE